MFSTALLLCAALGGGIAPAAGVAAQDLAIPEAAYPSLPGKAASAEGFAPSGWVLEAQAFGDLNRDGVPDLALVLRQNERGNVIENPGLGENPFDTNPRILAVAFRHGPRGDYILRHQNHTLIPRRTTPVAEDPFDADGLKIERGNVRVVLRWFLSAGGWETFTAAHTFQHRNGRFELIGYDRSQTHRGSGETKEVSVNFLTGRMRVATGTIEGDNPKVAWKALPPRAPLTLDSVGDGLDFDPAP